MANVFLIKEAALIFKEIVWCAKALFNTNYKKKY